MASSSVAIAPSDTNLDWRKMNKQELRDALESRGLDTSGLRPSLIQRLESSLKTSASAGAHSSGVVTQKLYTSVLQKGVVNESEKANGAVRIYEDEPTGEVQDVVEVKDSDSIALDVAIETSSLKEEKEVVDRKCEIGGTISIPISDLDRKRRRAERFGVGLKVSEEEKLMLRAERFSGKKASLQESESERRERRAVRFGIVDEATKKKASEQRFGIVKKNLSEDAKRKARAERFGMSKKENPLTWAS